MQDETRRFRSRAFVALLMLLAMACLAVTGLGLHDVSEGGQHGRLLIGMSRHDWMSVHVALGIVLVAASMWHIVYNWRALWRYVRPKDGHVRLGVEMLAAAAAVAVLMAVVFVHRYLG